jgi:hypothetical protein
MLKKIIHDNTELFQYYGRDIETIFEKSQINSCERSILSDEINIITQDDIMMSIKELEKNRKLDKDVNYLNLYL